MDDNFDDIHDMPLIDKDKKSLYECLRKNILFRIQCYQNISGFAKVASLIDS
jgi:hypothetical protein